MNEFEESQLHRKIERLESEVRSLSRRAELRERLHEAEMRLKETETRLSRIRFLQSAGQYGVLFAPLLLIGSFFQGDFGRTVLMPLAIGALLLGAVLWRGYRRDEASEYEARSRCKESIEFYTNSINKLSSYRDRE